MMLKRSGCFFIIWMVSILLTLPGCRSAGKLADARDFISNVDSLSQSVQSEKNDFQQVPSPTGGPVNTEPVADKMKEISDLLDKYFVDGYDPEALSTAAADAAAAAMIEATGDRWSYYISADEMAVYEENLYNSYVGIGVTIRMSDQGVEILSVTRGGTAQEAELRVGDIITHVEGQSTLDLGVDGTKDIVRGEAGTFVRLTVLKDGVSVEMELERRQILVDVATWELLDQDIGLITIANFDYHCAEQTLEAIDILVDQGAKALLFDVRFNGGGLKDEMVRILDALLPEGDLFRSVDYAGKEEIDTSDAQYLSIPMAVLVNEDSYSAAEFFAAALQEYDAAEVVGMPTVGKGNYQCTMPLSDGSAVAISMGKYYTPNGRSLTDVGVKPDVKVDMTDEEYESLYYGNLTREKDPQLQAALRLLETKIS